MAGPARVQVTGARELRRALKRMGDDVEDLKAIHREAAETVADEARGRAPVLTGNLRSTVRFGATKTRAYVSAGRKRVPYAGPIHFGWPARNIEAQPFMYDAMDARANEVAERYVKRIEDLVKRVGRETPG